MPDSIGVYPYINSLNSKSNKVTSFKSRETYRFGLIFQHKSGKWSEVVYAGDKTNNVNIVANEASKVNTLNIQAQLVLNNNVLHYTLMVIKVFSS